MITGLEHVGASSRARRLPAPRLPHTLAGPRAGAPTESLWKTPHIAKGFTGLLFSSDVFHLLLGSGLVMVTSQRRP